MSSLALMRFLEASPERYDAGMRLITFGCVTKVHDALAAMVPRDSRVLEVGCGTGSVTLALLERGARVTALDQNPEMLGRARARVAEALPPSTDPLVEWIERTASEIDSLGAAGYDVVVMSLCLSEMSRDERRYVLDAARAVLKPGGVLLAADEVRPRRVLARIVHTLLRAPQWLFAWLLAGTVSRALPDLADEIVQARFMIRSEQRWLGDSLALVRAEPMT